jgi:inorganic pyrophosphatase
VCAHTGHKGDKDPIDILDISDSIAATGEIKVVKVLGVIALVDEGETDWKIIAIDVNDPKAEKVNGKLRIVKRFIPNQFFIDIDDVDKEFPGLLAMTRQWFRAYKIPDGKPENEFAFNGEYKNRDFAMKIIRETGEAWQALMAGNIPKETETYSISTVNASSLEDSLLMTLSASLHQEALVLRDLPKNEEDCTKSYFGLFPFYN